MSFSTEQIREYVRQVTAFITSTKSIMDIHDPINDAFMACCIHAPTIVDEDFLSCMKLVGPQPLTGISLFMKEYLPVLDQAGIPNKDKLKEINKAWYRLSSVDKEVYNTQALAQLKSREEAKKRRRANQVVASA